jgi:putative transposase
VVAARRATSLIRNRQDAHESHSLVVVRYSAIFAASRVVCRPQDGPRIARHQVPGNGTISGIVPQGRLSYNPRVSYISLYVHVIFSTKERRKQIPEAIQPRLWAYMGGIARANGFKAITIGGIEDHVHLLLSVPATIPIAKAVQVVKAGSSKWMHDEIGKKVFSWQESYGAFSIGISQVPDTMRYIDNQRVHHRKRNFAEEFALFLKKHGIMTGG